MRRAASVSLMAAAMRLERDEAETGAKVLCWFVEAEQGFQWSLIATVNAAHAPFVVHLDFRLVRKDDGSSDTD